jgi:hypothetical protein
MTGSTRFSVKWDQRANSRREDGLVSQGVMILEGRWTTLEEGLQIQFHKSGEGEGHRYRTGHYWLIPVGLALGDVFVAYPRRPRRVRGASRDRAPLRTAPDRRDYCERSQIHRQLSAKVEDEGHRTFQEC